MTRGLVIGKFLPVHNGHIELIRFAAGQCDELFVSMSYRADDPIDPTLRFEWLQSIFVSDRKIVVKTIPDDFDNDKLPWPERTRIWAQKMAEVYPAFDVVFSSEEYGAFFAENLNARNILFDPARTIVPISETLIRQNPMKYWDFIPPVVRSFFVKKVCFYGPESTGKSVMAIHMAERYGTVFVPEVAREFLDNNDFTLDDIERIGYAHLERIRSLEQDASRILFVDTDAITTKIYSQYYLGAVPPALDQLESQVRYDHYFLFDIDVPWVPDGLRDLGHLRSEMFELFRANLEIRNIPYTLVKGSWDERQRLIEKQLELMGVG